MMRLIDYFIELFAYVSCMQESPSAEQPGFERVKTDISQLIIRSREKMARMQGSQEDFELAEFAVFAWIDEAMMNSRWSEKGRWQSEQLQRTYFRTADAGELFFEKLNQIQPHQTEVREVYYVCLALGFTGRYCHPGDEFLLKQLQASNLKLLGKTAISEGKLFPGGYADEMNADPGQKRRLFSITTLVGGGIPVMLVVFLFFIYRFVLSNVGENLINTIH